jgi:hypothetical protein
MFKPDLTLANLEGRKTRTSRCKGLDKINEHPDKWVVDFVEELNIGDAWFSNTTTMRKIKCPYGVVGSELYGKETYWQYGYWKENGVSKSGKTAWSFVPDWSQRIWYAEEKSFHCWEHGREMPGYYKRSAMMMPERASRYHIILTGIGVQRIQSISHKDITAEGLGDGYTDIGWNYAFGQLWDSINLKTHPWSSNPWVWYLYYTVKKKE